MHVVTVRMRLTSENLSDIQSFKAAFDGLYFFQRIYLKTCAGKCSTHLFGCKVEVNILFQPFV